MARFGIETRQVACIGVTVGVAILDVEKQHKVVTMVEAHVIAPLWWNRWMWQPVWTCRRRNPVVGGSNQWRTIPALAGSGVTEILSNPKKSLRTNFRTRLPAHRPVSPSDGFSGAAAREIRWTANCWPRRSSGREWCR